MPASYSCCATKQSAHGRTSCVGCGWSGGGRVGHRPTGRGVPARFDRRRRLLGQHGTQTSHLHRRCPPVVDCDLCLLESPTPDENGQRWADVIDFLTMYPDARRRVVRVLGKIDAWRKERGVSGTSYRLMRAWIFQWTSFLMLWRRS